MNFIRTRWQRGPIHQFFTGMEPIDRATFWVTFALALALGLSISAITAHG